ncbi:hypothetical protein [Morganella morganii]|uniref:hypothetical protein n=1 Tax=Morganella morganii TaxID=582 RepID=UPI001BDB8C2C|nr:hypothetical protein [Morganella morganii]ELB1110834.1 hypothetical protein [Morganella morganii]MBT0460583.1 hypothetical protein [Morganella morganii subsp. morganii]
MTLVEGFSIFGSLASVIAIGVSLWIFWRQRNSELSRLRSERNNELFALKEIIKLNCESIKKSLEGNKIITDMIESREYAGTSIYKIGGYSYISFKDGREEDTGEYYWKTSCRFNFISKFMDNDLLILARHNKDIIKLIMSIHRCIDEVNNATESVINEFQSQKYTVVPYRSNSMAKYSMALDIHIDNLIVELSLI